MHLHACMRQCQYNIKVLTVLSRASSAGGQSPPGPRSRHFSVIFAQNLNFVNSDVVQIQPSRKVAGNGFDYFEIWSHEFDFGAPK